MLKFILNKLINSMQHRYDYDAQYMQDMLSADTRAFIKYLAFQMMASHKANLSAEQLFAAKIRTIIRDDCGPCTQLMVQMAQEAGVKDSMLAADIALDMNNLPEDIALIVNFTEACLNREPLADDLREQIIKQFGQQGLVALSLAISSTRVYPTLKYVLGHGKTCSRVMISDKTVKPIRPATQPI
ncbi:hypothetical protein HR060_09205 [Catenovulum sp. SM1970]|uniref:hypothetical protein n=1 Tax=Marinifaba aquimaris TaxID=2741323 RepID=UPI001573C199|nr:hypothetical protein [Marinifaba aquimaris]NTS77049.1 hypothetical protein [Marinifaba aquimaris]